MSFVLVNSPAEVTALPDGTLISWVPVINDPSSEAVAFVRKQTTDVNPGGKTPVTLHDAWIAPGNGWEPEPVSSIVFPARIILLGVPQSGDHVPEGYLTSTDEDDDDVSAYTPDEPQWEATITGGTYPRDVALQAAVQLYGRDDPELIQTSIADVLATATAFADWLTADPMTDRITDLVNQGVVDQMAPISLSDVDQDPYFGHDH